MDQAEFGFNTSDYDTSYWDDEFENGNLPHPPMAKKRIQFKTLPKSRFKAHKSPPYAPEKSKSRRKSYSAFLKNASERKTPSNIFRNMPEDGLNFPRTRQKSKTDRENQKIKAEPKNQAQKETKKQIKNQFVKEPKHSLKYPKHNKNTQNSLFKTASKYLSKLFENSPNNEKKRENPTKKTDLRRKATAAPFTIAKTTDRKEKKAKSLLLKAVTLIGEKKLFKTFVDHLAQKSAPSGRERRNSTNTEHSISGSGDADAFFSRRQRFREQKLAAESQATQKDCAAVKQQLAELTIEFQRLNVENESLRGENFRLRLESKEEGKKRTAGIVSSGATEGSSHASGIALGRSDSLKGGRRAVFTGDNGCNGADSDDRDDGVNNKCTDAKKRATGGSGKTMQRKQLWYSKKLEKWKRENVGYNEIELREVKERLKEWWRRMSLTERRRELLKEDWR